MMQILLRTAFFLAVCAGVLAGRAAPAGEPGESAVLKWRDGRKAVFLLAFDDSCQSHVRKAIPELERRGMVGTFYINPGNGPYISEKSAWEQRLPQSPAVVYGNHTFRHSGATNTVHLDSELARCQQEVWVTDHITWHKYQSERSGARITVRQADAASITIALACSADPALYDLPLSLETQVPASWRECRITQGKTTVQRSAGGGRVRYDALPNAEEIVITPLR